MEVKIVRDEVNNMGRTEAQKRADLKSRKKIYDQITVVDRKENRLKELLEVASTKTGLSKNEYMVKSIYTQLAHDGITIDMLPTDSKYIPPHPEPKQPKRYIIYMITEIWLQRNRIIESFIASFATLNTARKYVQDKINKKAYPEDWIYTIRGRCVEANNKQAALEKLREVIKKSLEAHNEDERIEIDRKMVPCYLAEINEFSPVEYFEMVSYDGNELKFNEGVDINMRTELDDEVDALEFEELDDDDLT